VFKGQVVISSENLLICYLCHSVCPDSLTSPKKRVLTAWFWSLPHTPPTGDI